MINKPRNPSLANQLPLFPETHNNNQTLKTFRQQYKKLAATVKQKDKDPAKEKDSIEFVTQYIGQKIPMQHIIQTAQLNDDTKTIEFLKKAGVSEQIIAHEKEYMDFRDMIILKNMEGMEYFINKGIDIARPILGWTPLMIAVDNRASWPYESSS